MDTSTHPPSIYRCLTCMFRYCAGCWAYCFYLQKHGYRRAYGTSALVVRLCNKQYTQTHTRIYFVMGSVKQNDAEIDSNSVVVVVTEVSLILAVRKDVCDLTFMRARSGCGDCRAESDRKPYRKKGEHMWKPKEGKTLGNPWNWKKVNEIRAQRAQGRRGGWGGQGRVPDCWGSMSRLSWPLQASGT